jgi:ABC-type multidrug transport system fused ATPase/permease subunit
MTESPALPTSEPSAGLLRDLWTLARPLNRSDRARWLLLIPIVSAAAVVEALGALAVFGLLRILIEPGRVWTTPVVADVWKRWPGANEQSFLQALAVGVAAFYVLRALFLLWAEWMKEAVIERSGARAADRLFARYLAADYAFHLRRRSSSLIEEVARSTDIAYHFVGGAIVNIFSEVATLTAIAVVLVVTAPARTLLAIVAVLLVAAIPTLLTRRLWARWSDRTKSLEAQQLHVLQQSLGAVKEVKITGREAFFESRLRAVRRMLAHVRQRRAAAAAALRLGVEAVLIVAMLLTVLLASGQPTGESVSVLALFAYAGFRAVPSANRIMLNVGYLREGRPYARAVAADLSALRDAPVRPHGPEPVVEFQDSLACERVEFRYEDAARPALQDVNLRIRRGESVGIVGPTGSGKSTLVDVLMGLLRPTSGRVLLDGDDLAGRERAWQRIVGYVPQDPYLLDDSLRRNVAFGIPDPLIDEGRVARACTLAQLDEFIRQLPEGIETNVGEDGVRLSGGQRQRVAIARALYHDPAVLVFDEATAALDQQTEREVTRAIAALHGQRTLIVIAHRLTTVENCDRLIFLQDGRIAAIGRYEDLMRHPGFRAMAVR